MSKAWSWLGAVLLLGGPAASAELDGALQARIDAVVERAMTQSQMPGLALGVFRNGQPVYVRAYGHADLEHRVPVKPDTVFQSGSVGKMFTATAVMLLAREGKLSLDDAISKHFPEAPAAWRGISVRHLLSHRSGIADYDDKGFDLRRDYRNDELVARFAEWPLDFEPGARFSYSNSGYVLLGILVEKVSGQFYGDFLAQKVFAPLGMTRTSVNDVDAIVPDRAEGYDVRDGKFVNDEWVSNSLSTLADGSLLFTVPDLGKWDAALYGDAVLPQRELREMFHAAPLNDGTLPLADYGYGWETHDVRGHRLVAHGGRWQGFTTYLARFVDKGLTLAVLCNSATGGPDDVALRVAGLIDPALAPYAAIDDSDPALTAVFKNAVFAYLQGRPEPRAFVSSNMPALHARQVARVRSDAGELESDATFELVDARDATHRTYRIKDKNTHLLVDLEFTRARKIRTLRFREE